MSPGDVDRYLEDFPLLTRKIFVYKQEFLPNEYITIEKTMEKKFRVTEQKTADIQNFVDKVTDFILEEEFKKLLMTEQLKENKNETWFMNIKDLKTNKCECGAWATQNPDHHAFWCKRW